MRCVFLLNGFLVGACKSYFVALVQLSLRFVYDFKYINKEINIVFKVLEHCFLLVFWYTE